MSALAPDRFVVQPDHNGEWPLGVRRAIAEAIYKTEWPPNQYDRYDRMAVAVLEAILVEVEN